MGGKRTIANKIYSIITFIIICMFPLKSYSSFPVDSEADNKKESSGDELLFQPYKENYILFLSTRGDSKFQISFKYKFFTNSNESILSLAQSIQKTFLERLYFGYTQKSVWDWNKESAPFEDHNFNPEIFWCNDSENCNELKRNNELFSSRYYIGAEHESNGRDGPSSRSWNRLYLRGIYWKGSYAIAPKVWYILSKSSDNPDIADYLGYFDLELFARNPSGVAYGLTFRRGVKGGSVIADMSIPNKVMMKKVFGVNSNFNPHWYIQLFSGYGEDLLMYKQKRDVLRFGIRLTL